MDDLAGKIGELLGSPEGMERIRNLASMLGQSQSQPSEPAEETAPAPAPAASPLAGLGSLGNLGNLGGLGALGGLGGLGNMDSDMLGTTGVFPAGGSWRSPSLSAVKRRLSVPAECRQPRTATFINFFPSVTIVPVAN